MYIYIYVYVYVYVYVSVYVYYMYVYMYMYMYLYMYMYMYMYMSHSHSYSFLKSQLMGVQFPWLYCNTPKTNPSPAPPSVSQPVQIPETTDMFMVKSTALVGLTWFKPQFGAVNPLHSFISPQTYFSI